MADELTLSGSMSYSKNGVKVSISGSQKVTVVGDHVMENVADIAATEESLEKGDIGTIGYVMFRNLDPDNFIEIGKSTGVYGLRLDPGESAGPLRWNGTAAFAKADTAPVKLAYVLIEA